MSRRWIVVLVVVALIIAGVVLDQSYTPTPTDLARYAVEAAQECTARGRALPPKPFTTDGCSLWPDGKNLDACIRHDMEYWCGGSAEDRQTADARLANTVGGVSGMIMEAGVRLGGIPYLLLPWRWG